MDPLLIITIIMILTSIIVGFLGYRRGVPNTTLWVLFTFFHGLHELCDYAVESLSAPFWVERAELFFAYGSAISLLAAAFEFNGVITQATGKIVGILLLGIASFYLFTLTEETLDSIADTKLDFMILHSEPNRFMFGFLLVITSALVILFTYLYLKKQAVQKKLLLTPHNKPINLGAAILLVVFSIFEGFDSTNPIFIELRGISLAIFIIIPIVFVLTNKPGLQRLLVVSDAGELIYGFDFGNDSDLFSNSSESDLDNAIMTAGFLAAITGFSGQIVQGNASFSVKTGGFYFTLLKSGKNLFALQSLNPSKAMERTFVIFTQKIDPALLIATSVIKKTDSPVKPIVQSKFRPFY